MATRLFKPFARYLDPNVPLPDAARRRALVAMWLSILGASAVLWTKSASPALLATLIALGLIGTLVILRFRRGPSAPRSEHSVSL